MDPNKPSGLKKPGFSRLPTASAVKKPGDPNTSFTSSPSSSSLANPSTSSIRSSDSQARQQQQEETQSKSSPAPSGAAGSGIPTLTPKPSEERTGDDQETTTLKNSIKDLTEKLETLKLKRSEDREKLREFDKFKLQIQQLQEFKSKAQEMISGLNKDLDKAKQEAKQMKDQYEAYKDEMSNHEQRIEEMTVDKELAEARAEELQENEIKLNEKLEELKLELEVLKGEIELNGKEGAASTFQNKQMEKEHETLKAALIKLRDLSLQDKSEINSLRKQNEENQKKLNTFTKENESLREQNNSNMIEINELKDQVTATLGSVQMIEQLTEQNLDLEAKIIELRDTISDLEEINEVNDQLQENAREEEKELRQNLDLAESRIREAEKQIESLKYNLADNDKTILKFRELVKQLQVDNDSLNRQIKSKLEEEKAHMSEKSTASTFDFQKKFIETKNIARIIENEVNKIELDSQKKYNNYLLSYMSDIFLKKGSGDNECILTLLFFKRISNKAELILNHVREKITDINSNDESVKINVQGQLKFLYEVCIYLENIKLISNKYDFILNNCDPNIYHKIGMMYYDFNLHEKSLDLLIDLLQKNQLDENINLEPIEKMCLHFQTIYKNYLANEKVDEIVYLTDLSNFGKYCAESITIDLQRLNSIIEVKDETAEIVLLFKELNTKNEDLKLNLKKIYKNLPKEEKIKNKVVISFSSVWIGQLENCVQDLYLMFKTLKELFVLASNSKLFNDSSELLTAKRLENFAYQVCDKTYLKEDNGPYENLRNSMNQTNETLSSTNSNLENGEFETELTEEEFNIRKYMINSPVIKAAEKFKNTLNEAEAIKYKLETKEEEIKELKKNYKLKSDELSEQKLRISLIEKKAEDAQKELEEKDKKLNQTIEESKSISLKKEKEHSDTLEALQQELDTLQNERRDLKEQLRKKVFTNILNRQDSSASNESGKGNTGGSGTTGGNFGVSDSSALIEELKQVKSINRVLQRNCVYLRQSLSQKMLAELPSLPVIQSSNLALKEQPFDSKPHKKDENINSLMKNSKDLMKDVYITLANIKVQNLKTDSNSTILKRKNKEKEYLTAFEINNKINNINTLLSNHLPENLKTKEKKLIAEFDIFTANPSAQKVIDLNLNKSEIKELLMVI